MQFFFFSFFIMAPTVKNIKKSLSTKCLSPRTLNKENDFLHSVSEFHSRVRRRESIRFKYKVSALFKFSIIIIAVRGIIYFYNSCILSLNVNCSDLYNYIFHYFYQFPILSEAITVSKIVFQ